MLTYFQVLLLPIEEKLHYVLMHGTLLLNRYNLSGKVSLYAIGHFYAEVSYKGLNQVAEVVLFKNTTYLEHYLEEISVAGLIGP